MNRIFYVEGRTGEYADRQEWQVRASFSEEKMQALCARLNAWCVDHGYGLDQVKPDGFSSYRSYSCPEDPNFRCDYVGTQYSVCSMPFET